jgi:putative phosphoesterase
MKIVLVSDIHGKCDNLPKIDLNCDKLIILGDIFGPSFADNQVIADFIIKHESKIALIKGNCDNEEVFNHLGFKYYDFLKMDLDKHHFCFLHGHNLSLVNQESDVIVFGHKHYPFIEKKDKQIFICVGSLSMPRNESKCCYAIYENDHLKIIDLEQNVIEEIYL